MTNHKKDTIVINQWELMVKTGKLRKARENADDPEAFDIGFTSDWL